MKFNQHSIKEGSWVLGATLMLVCFAAIVQMSSSKNIEQKEVNTQQEDHTDDIVKMLDDITDKVVVRSYCRNADMVSVLSEQKRMHTRNLMIPHYRDMAKRLIEKVGPLLNITQNQLTQDINHITSKGYRLPTEYECKGILGK